MLAEGHEAPPSSVEVLSRYPGIGPYTAGAVASIAYNVPAPAVDGNVERVTARLFDLEEAAGSPALRRMATEKVLEMMPEGNARAFNQALMELGALVCLPSKPLCGKCPCESRCFAAQGGVQLARPLPKARPALEKISAWGVLPVIEGVFLLHRRPNKGLWAGFWEIPWFARETENALSDLRAWGEEVGLECLSCAEVGTARFSFTNHQVTAWFVTCGSRLLSPLKDKIRDGEWGLHGPEDLASLTLPSPSRKFLKLLQERFPRFPLF
jgi:A/G-specific adenine glycosylase